MSNNLAYLNENMEPLKIIEVVSPNPSGTTVLTSFGNHVGEQTINLRQEMEINTRPMLTATEQLQMTSSD